MPVGAKPDARDSAHLGNALVESTADLRPDFPARDEDLPNPSLAICRSRVRSSLRTRIGLPVTDMDE